VWSGSQRQPVQVVSLLSHVLPLQAHCCAVCCWLVTHPAHPAVWCARIPAHWSRQRTPHCMVTGCAGLVISQQHSTTVCLQSTAAASIMMHCWCISWQLTRNYSCISPQTHSPGSSPHGCHVCVGTLTLSLTDSKWVCCSHTLRTNSACRYLGYMLLHRCWLHLET
jgi:hypothetical protein